MKQPSDNLKRLLPVLAVMAVIFIHSAMPADLSSQESSFFVELLQKWLPVGAGPLTFFVRKGAHFLEYAALGGAIWNYRSAQGKLSSWLAGVLYAGTDELHQYFVPGRSCEFRDICIDAAGVAAGMLALAAIRRFRRRGNMHRGCQS